MNFNVSAVGNKNTKSYAVDLQKNGETTWVSLLKGSVYSYNSTYVADNVLSIDSSYTLRLRVTDYFTTSEAIVDISSGFTLMDFRSTGKGAAVGKVSEKDAQINQLKFLIRRHRLRVIRLRLQVKRRHLMDIMLLHRGLMDLWRQRIRQSWIVLMQETI